jgi:hypothetical protein
MALDPEKSKAMTGVEQLPYRAIDQALDVIPKIPDPELWDQAHTGEL